MLTKSKFLALYHRQQESGLTVKEFCTNEGIAPSTFHYWKKKLSKHSSGSQDFIPLVVKSPQPLSDQNFSSLAQSSEAGTLLELVYPNGTQLRIKKDLDLTQLRALICLFD
jgi:hypothetical protein